MHPPVAWPHYPAKDYASALLLISLGCDAAPEAGGELRVDVLGELFPLGVEGLEALGAHACVFGGVERSAELYDDFVEFV